MHRDFTEMRKELFLRDPLRLLCVALWPESFGIKESLQTEQVFKSAKIRLISVIRVLLLSV